MKIKIRKAKKSDVEAIYNLGMATKEFWVSPQTKFYTKKELYNWLKNPKENTLLIALCNNKVVGFSFTKIMSVEWAVVDTMAISLEFRGLGIGILLVKEGTKLLKKKGINLISGLVGTEHLKAIKFWKKIGYRMGKKFFWMERNI
ncbi:MAG: GNAT family N-acetyltransferase [Candidatus Yanofskybacteria bacterium]|nr:GNAT family N-acetyltransferase [Candidatus Yanofskybacteria bacterium]